MTTRYINPRPAEMQRGTQVRIEFEGRVIDAMVILASPNGRSLILTFDGLVGGYLGNLPIVWEDEFMGYMDLIRNHRVRFVQRES